MGGERIRRRAWALGLVAPVLLGLGACEALIDAGDLHDVAPDGGAARDAGFDGTAADVTALPEASSADAADAGGDTSVADVSVVDSSRPDSATEADGGDSGSTLDGGTTADGSGAGPYWTFTDGFDVGSFHYWTGLTFSSNGTITVVDAGAYSGCCALHATAAADAGVAYETAYMTWTKGGLSVASAPAVQSGTIAVRFFERAASADISSDELQIGSGGGGSPTAVANAGLQRVQGKYSWQLYENDPTNPTGTATNFPGAETLPEMGYQCIEIVMNVSPTSGALTVYQDSTLVATLPSGGGKNDTSAGDAGWDTVNVGLPYSSGTSPTDLLIDDVTIALYNDNSPGPHIGCN